MDFAKFYDDQVDYTSFRSDAKKLEEYKIAIQWKVDRLAKAIKGSEKFENILEVGCALGILLNSIADRLLIKDRFGIDISSENIKFAKNYFPNTDFICGTVEDVKRSWEQHYQFKKFDLVLLSDVVEHIPDDEGFMREISTITNYVLLNLPLEKCFNNRKRKYGESDPSGHLRNYNVSDAVQLIEKTGFEIVSHFTDNAHFDKIFFSNYKIKRTARVVSKPLPQRVFWSIYYSAEELIKGLSPWLYKKKYGANYFALLKVKN